MRLAQSLLGVLRVGRECDIEGSDRHNTLRSTLSEAAGQALCVCGQQWFRSANLTTQGGAATGQIGSSFMGAAGRSRSKAGAWLTPPTGKSFFVSSHLAS